MTHIGPTSELPGADLAAVRLFRGLPRRHLDRIAELARYATFAPATTLTMRGLPGDVLYVVLAGTVKVEVASGARQRAILAILGPGEVLGELSVVDGYGRSATAVTLEPASFIWFDGETFVELLEQIPRLAYNLAESLARRLRASNQQRHARVALDVKGRLAFQLLQLAAELGEPTDEQATRIAARLTQSDLAALVDASRARVNQALAELRRAGAVAVDATGAYVVLRAAELEPLAGAGELFPM